MNGKTPRIKWVTRIRKSVHVDGTFMNLSGEGLKSR